MAKKIKPSTIRTAKKVNKKDTTGGRGGRGGKKVIKKNDGGGKGAGTGAGS